MSENKMIGAIDAKYRRKIKQKRDEWGKTEYRKNADGSTQGYEEYLYTITPKDSDDYTVKGIVRWWRKN